MDPILAPVLAEIMASGVELATPGSAELMATLMGKDMLVRCDPTRPSGTAELVTKSGRTIRDEVAARVRSTDFAHLLADTPINRGQALLMAVRERNERSTVGAASPTGLAIGFGLPK